MPLVERLLAREHAAGRIGEHVEPADVLLAISMLADVLARSEADQRQAMAERARTIFRNAFCPALSARAERPTAGAATSTERRRTQPPAPCLGQKSGSGSICSTTST